MRNYLCATALSLTMVLGIGPAHACVVAAGLDVHDIKFASVVVVGRVSNYEIVSPHRPGTLSDYARFTVVVEELLAGQAPQSLSVTWNNSTFGEPDKMGEGPFLIGLRDPSSKSPPLRGPSATTFPSAEPKLLTVLQAPCAPPFILESAGFEADAVREILRKAPK